MRSRLAVKLALLFVLGLLFGIPQLVIGLVGSERRHYHDEAIADIARSNAGEQTVNGPVVLLPYRVRLVERTTDPASGRTAVQERVVERTLQVLPDSLEIGADLALEARSRGIYSTRLFRTRVKLAGRFAAPATPRPSDGEFAGWGEPSLHVGVSDSRGMREAPSVEWAGRGRACEPGTRVPGLGAGFHCAIEPPRDSAAVAFAVEVPLVGTQAFRVVPLGRTTRATLASSWPHPSFDGRFLPDERTVNDKGFRATWKLSRFATGAEPQPAGGEPSAGRIADVSGGAPLAFGVRFLDPVDSYRLTERALKYGLLFVLLTFTAFFLLEVLRGLDVHPMQYGLVGAALTIFFLLLLSLSEHLPYVAAYVVAAFACVALVTAYVRGVLGSAGRAAAFGGGLAVLYALLYVVMRSQDYALLLGSVLLFAVLAFVMLATRGVDWSRIGERRA